MFCIIIISIFSSLLDGLGKRWRQLIKTCYLMCLFLWLLHTLCLCLFEIIINVVYVHRKVEYFLYISCPILCSLRFVNSEFRDLVRSLKHRQIYHTIKYKLYKCAQPKSASLFKLVVYSILLYTSSLFYSTALWCMCSQKPLFVVHFVSYLLFAHHRTISTCVWDMYSTHVQ